LYTRKDTVEKVFGTPVVLFSSNGNAMTGWTSSTGWGVDNTIFYSPTGSIADSPNSDYGSSDVTRITTSSAVNLNGVTNATLSYRTRWEIQSRYDYAEVQASTNGGGSYTPLCGKYTKPGTAFQHNLQPVYDGFMFPWVQEEVILDNYINQNVLLRFIMDSDNNGEYDGFFFDDLKVEAILVATGVKESGDQIQLSIFPNPTTGEVQLALVNAQFAKVQIADVLGNVVLNYEFKTSQSAIDLSSQPKGIYFVKVIGADGNFGVKKIVLQ